MTDMEIEKLKEDYLKSERANIIPFENILKQIEIFKKGIPFVKLKKPCIVGDGIKVIPKEKKDDFTKHFQKAAGSGRVMKFVPASGAATRMFKKLHSMLLTVKNVDRQSLQDLVSQDNEDAKAVDIFIKNIHKFAFYDELKSALSNNGYEIEKLLGEGNYTEIIKHTLHSQGLNYACQPKGSILFHRYPEGSRTAFEEHLVEALNYAADDNNTAKIHFTISPEHKLLAEKIINSAVNKYEKKGYKIRVGYSFQKPSTDTIAVTIDNKPFKDKDGKLVFRPAGHGALLENLNDLNGDIIFIKNIDNLVTDHLRDETYIYKKLLAGYLIEIQEKVYGYLQMLEKQSTADSNINEIKNFAVNELSLYIDDKFNSLNFDEKQNALFKLLNRPIRVCGMVKNEGHPGGGPFWIEDKDGSVSLQIVEKTQIDINDEQQKKILESSTHFNPVDLVCAVRNYKGEVFNLPDFTDPGSGLITIKSKDGKELKALELPGLWNGSMANWITVFIEVPKITFNPVKEVNDLLKPEHQPSY